MPAARRSVCLGTDRRHAQLSMAFSGRSWLARSAQRRVARSREHDSVALQPPRRAGCPPGAAHAGRQLDQLRAVPPDARRPSGPHARRRDLESQRAAQTGPGYGSPATNSVVCSIRSAQGAAVVAQGIGTSKQKAEKAAAKASLRKMNVLEIEESDRENDYYGDQ